MCVLLDLDGGVDLAHKEVARVEPDGAGEEEELQGHDERVAKVDHRRNKLGDLELREEVEHAVEEHVQRRGSRGQERAPPPVVVLAAQLEVAHDHGDLGTGHEQNDKHNEEEAKQIVELVQPDGGQNEEQLDEDRSKRQYAPHQYRYNGLHVPHLYCVCAPPHAPPSVSRESLSSKGEMRWKWVGAKE